MSSFGNMVFYREGEVIVWRYDDTRIGFVEEANIDNEIINAYLEKYPSMLQTCDEDVNMDGKLMFKI